MVSYLSALPPAPTLPHPGPVAGMPRLVMKDIGQARSGLGAGKTHTHFLFLVICLAAVWSEIAAVWSELPRFVGPVFLIAVLRS